jgi:hypothetical protein
MKSHDNTVAQKAASSPYATGGGGTVLEHRYGATVLAALLLEDSVPGLGEDFAVERVEFQASTESFVDDLRVTGVMRRGEDVDRRHLAIGVRRDPTIAPSDPNFMKLLLDCLKTLEKHGDAFNEGTYRLAIVVAANHTGAEETSQLADGARCFSTSAEFCASIATPGKVAERLRLRLGYLERAVAAAQEEHAPLAAHATPDLCWRLLRSLWMHQCRLEEDDSDHLHCISRLKGIVGTTSEADELFDQLHQMAAKFAVGGGVVDHPTLRRLLAGRVRISRARSYAAAWKVFDRLAESLRARTPRVLRPLTEAGQEVRFERREARESLLERVREVAAGGGVLIVAGEPGVGKSALTIEVCDALARTGVATLMLSLRDLRMDSVIQFEGLLKGNLSEVFGASEVSSSRLLLLDGAEVVQEGYQSFVGDLVRAACGAGFALVAVTRQDAVDNVEEILRASLASLMRIGPKHQVPTHKVEGFTELEVDELALAVPSLRRLAQDKRSRWLLRRPGLLKLVLESRAVASLPEGPLCEAVVYDIVWQHLIRQGERIGPTGATPDGRDHVVYRLARSLLLPAQPVGSPYPDAHAPRSLRVDGVLLRTGLLGRRADQFASDLLRDIALWQVLLRESPRLLLEAGVPRWASHAALVAFQALLLDRPEVAEEWRLPAQVSFCRDLAKNGTERWAELPWEAVLTITSPIAVLEAEWGWLSSESGKPLRELMRVLKVRFSDPQIGDAVIALLCDHQRELAGLHYDLAEEADEATLQWLRSMAALATKDVSNALRIRVRDEFIYSSSRSGWNGYERYVECVGLLGADLDQAAEERLRAVARDRPHGLQDCMENGFPPLSLAVHRPELLLDLAEAYYIQARATSDSRSRGVHDLGVRGHSLRFWGLGAALAAFYYGPFKLLLNSRVMKGAIGFINRLLDHAAQGRVEQLGDPNDRYFRDESGVDTGLDVDLPGLGRRHFTGDGHVWRWYRGSGVGPYPCISALMALEVAADTWISAGIPVAAIATALLQDASSLAMAGFVYGMLVRHLEKAEQSLDPWLATPEVWRLEARRTAEESSRYSFTKAGDVMHPERRQWEAAHVAGWLVMKALVAADHQATARLASVGACLIENARQRHESAVSNAQDLDPSEVLRLHDDFVVFQRYAGMLDVANYPRVERDGHVEIGYVPPPEVEQALAKSRDDAMRGRQIYEFQARYGFRKEPVPADQVGRDLVAARSLLEHPPESGAWIVGDAVAALALVALQMNARSELSLSGEDLAVVLAVLTLVVEGRPTLNPVEDGSLYSIGGDRAAARALPLTLIATLNWSDMAPDDLQELSNAVPKALGQLARSPVIEVQVALVDGLGSVWASPCRDPGQGSCPHGAALDLVIESARCARLGPWDSMERRGIDPLPLPLDKSLSEAAAGDLLKWRLATVIGALGACAATGCCVAEKAYDLLVAVVRAYGAAAADNDHLEQPAGEEARFLVAASLLPLSPKRGAGLLLDLFERLLASPPAAARLLSDLCLAATYGQPERAALKPLWADLMNRFLDAWGAGVRKPGAHVERMDDGAGTLAYLLPMPRARMHDERAGVLVVEASRDWVEPAAISGVMDRWIPLAVGAPECVDAIAGFLKHRSIADRVQFGVPWLESVIDSRYDAVARRTYILMDWIRETLGSGQLPADAKRSLQRIVDGLAAQGDSRALQLQRDMEAGGG